MNKIISNSIIACFLIYTLFLSNFAFVAGSNILDNGSAGDSVTEIIELVNDVVGESREENVTSEVIEEEVLIENKPFEKNFTEEFFEDNFTQGENITFEENISFEQNETSLENETGESVEEFKENFTEEFFEDNFTQGENITFEENISFEQNETSLENETGESVEEFIEENLTIENKTIEEEFIEEPVMMGLMGDSGFSIQSLVGGVSREGYGVQSGVYNLVGVDEFIPLTREVLNLSHAFVIAPNMMKQENVTAGTSGDPTTNSDDSFVSIYLYNSTHIRVQRGVGDDGPVVVDWQILEAYDGEFSVQRGDVSYSGTSLTVIDNIPNSVNVNNSMSWFYIKTSYVGNNGDSIQFYSDITDSNTITFVRETGISLSVDFRWEVIEWNLSKINNFAKGYTGSITGSDTSPDCFNIGTIINKSSSILFHQVHSRHTGTGGLDSSARAGYIQDDSNVCFYDYDGVYDAGVKWFVIDFKDITQREENIHVDWGTTDYSDDVVLSGNYDLDKTLSFVSGTCNGDGTAKPRHTQWSYLMGNLANGLHIERTYGGQSREYAWQVLELPYFENIDAPIFSNAALNKSYGRGGETIRFSVEVSDASESVVSVNGTIGGVNVSFNLGTGNEWYYDFVCDKDEIVDFSYVESIDNGRPNRGNEEFVNGVSLICDLKDPKVKFEDLGVPANGSLLGSNSFNTSVSITEDNFGSINYDLYNSSGLVNRTTFFTPVNYFIFDSLLSGNYEYNVTVYDAAGNFDFTNTKNIELDIDSPLVSYSTGGGSEYRIMDVEIINPLGVISGTSILVEVTVDEPHEENITFRLYNSFGELERENNFFDQTRNVRWDNVVDGLYYYNVTVYDTLGFSNTSETRNVTLDNVLPSMDYSFGTSGDNFYTNYNWIYVNVSLIEDNFENITFSLYNSTDLLNETSFSNLITEINWTGFSDGEYWYNVTVWDMAVNINSSVMRKINLDNVLPIVDFGIGTEADNNNVSRNWIYINTSVTEINFENITFSLYGGTGLVNETTYFGNEREMNFTGLVTGFYYYNITVYDKAGNLASSSTRTIGVDVSGPSIQIINPQSKAYGNGTNMLLNYNVTDSIAGVNACWYNLDLGINNTVACGGFSQFTVGDGSHTLYFYANDTFGNLGQSQVTFLISTTGPAISLNKPVNDTFYTIATNTFFNYSTIDPDGVESCSLYGSWNGGWHLNQSDFSYGLIGNKSDRTCSQTWPALNCGATTPAAEGDNTWDSCRAVFTSDEYVRNVYLSDTSIIAGKQMNVTCEFKTYSSIGEDIFVWYYNGTGWRLLSQQINWPNLNGFYNYSVSFKVDNNLTASHYVRCGISWNTDSSNDFCANGGTNYYDNDDANFTVVAAKEEGNFTVNLTDEGNYNWNVKCNDSLSYVSQALNNYSVAVDLTNPLVDFGLGTFGNGVRVSSSSIYVNASVIEINFKNITFDLYKSGVGVGSQSYNTGKKNHTFTGLSDGIYAYNFTVYDKSGRVGISGTREIELDTTKPSGSSNTPVNGYFTKETSQNFTATVGDSVELKDATLFIFNSTGQMIYSYLIGLSGLTAVTIGVVYNFLYDDVFNWFYRVRDSVNNEYNTTSYSIEIDQTSPVVNFISPTKGDGNIVLQNYIYANTSVYEKNYKNMTFWLYNSLGVVVPSPNTFSDATRSINWTLLSDNVYWYNVTSYDLAGNNGFSETREIILDTTNPVVIFSGATKSNDSYVKGSSISVDVSVVEANEDNLIFSLYNGLGSLAKPQVPYLDGRRSINWTLLSEGIYYYNVSVFDKVNLNGITTTRKITLDNTLPVVNYSTGTETNFANKSHDWIFVNASVTEMNFGNITFNLWNGAGSKVGNVTFSDGTLEYNFTNLAYGVYYYNFTVYDGAGNNASVLTRQINLDTTKPFVDFIAPTEGDLVVRNRDWVYLNVSLIEDNFKEIKFALYDSEGLRDEEIFTDLTRAYNFTGLADDNYEYNVTVYDWAGNINSTETRHIGLDSAGPFVNIVKPRAKTYGYNESLSLEHTVSDRVSSLDTCWWNLDGGTNNSITCNSVTTFNTSVAPHILNFYSNDTFGNLGYDSVSFFISITGPAIELVSPMNNTFYSTSQDVNFSFLATDPDSVDVCSLYGDWTGSWGLKETYSGAWVDVGYENRREIDVVNIGATNLTDFPVYLNISSSHTLLGDYSDLRFFNGSCSEGQISLLSYEIEDYDSNNANVWLKIPSFVVGDNLICMYYGNVDADNVEDVAAVWSSSYSAVYHLDHIIGAAIDSSGGFSCSGASCDAEDGIDPDSNMDVLGIVGKGDYFDGSDYLGINPEWDVDGAHTYCTWINFASGHSGTILEDGGLTDGTGLGVTLTGEIRYSECYNGVFNPLDSGTTYADSNWHYVCGGHTGSLQFLYVDGELVNSVTQGDGISGSDNARIGAANGANPVFFDNSVHNLIGSLDELRISSIDRSGDWINQSYQQIANYDENILFGIEENFVGFTVPISQEGDYLWNVKCNDTIGYDSFALENYSFIMDVTNPIVLFGSQTEDNGKTVGLDWIFVDVNVIENNFKNITFNLYNSTGYKVRSSSYVDDGREHNFTGLSSGVYYYNVTVFDLANRKGSSSTRNINVDLSPPAGNLDGPASGSYLNNLVQNLTGSFIDATGLLNATLYVFNETGSLVFTSFVALAGVTLATVGIVYNFVKEGIYSWFYSVEDVVGNIYNTTNNTLTIDTTKPFISYVGGVEESGLVFERENIFVNVSISDLYFANLTFDLYDSDSHVFSHSFTDGTRDITWTNLPDEFYEYNVTIFDVAGNYNSTETRNIILDNLNPVINFGSGTLANGAYNYGDTIFVNVSVTEANEKNITFNLYNASGFNVRSMIFSDGTRSISWNLLDDGIYYYNVTVYDKVGHFASTSTRSIELDNVDPVISYGFGTEINNSAFARDWVYFKADIVETNFNNISLSLYNSSGLISMYSFSDTTRDYNWTNLPDGNYWYNATTFDKAGNKADTLTRKIILDKVNPLISFSIGTEIDNFNKTGSWVFVNVSFVEFNFKNITFELRDVNGVVNSTNYGSLANSINWTGLASNVYWYNVTVVDAAGNKNSTLSRKIGIDYLGPSIQIINPRAKAYGTNISLPLNYNVHDAIVGNDVCWYNLDIGSNVTVDCAGSATFNTSDGQHTLHFYANDTFGNLNYKNVTFLVSTTGPAIQLVEPEDNLFYAQATEVFFNYTAEDPDGVNSCSLYGNWNGGWHLNDSEIGFLITDDTDVTCNLFWEQDCSLDTATEFDNTFDDCSTKTGTDEMVRSMILNATEVAAGDTLNITCTFDLWNTDNVYFWYYNGTGWRKINEIINTQVGTVVGYTYSTVFVADNVFGNHTVRCGLNYNQDSESDECSDLGSYYDNDDINFTVVEPKTPEGFTLNISEEGTHEWNVKCNDSLGYDTWAAANYSMTFDVTNPVVDFGLNTLPDYSNVSQDYVYVNSFIVENNFENIIFYLYNDSGLIDSEWFNDSTRAYTFTNLDDGNYYYNMTVFDSAGRSGSSGTREIMLDTTNPVGSLGTPEDKSFVNNKIQNLTGSFSDGNGLKEVVLFIFNQTGFVYSQVVNLGGVLSSTIGVVYTFLMEGVYSWFYQAEDNVGNLYNTTNNTLTVDSTLPIISFISGTVSNNSYISQNYIYVNTSVIETNFKNVTFRFYNGGGIVSPSPNTFTNSKRDVNWTNLLDDEYFYNVTVWDLADNMNFSETRIITLDTILPVVSYSTGTEINFANKSRDWIFVNVSVTEMNFENITFRLYDGTSLVNETVYFGMEREINWTGLFDGVYYYNVTVYDRAGQSKSLMTREISLDKTKPLVAFGAGTVVNGAVFEREWIYVSSSVVENNFKNMSYRLYDNDSVLINSSDFYFLINNINFTASGENNTYFYEVVVYDWAGNNGSSGIRNISLVDVTNPSLILVNPKNITYPYINGIRLDYVVFDVHLDSCWYSLDGGENVSLPGCQGISMNFIDETGHIIELYVNDTLGYMNGSSVTFFVNSSLIETPTYKVLRGSSLFVDGTNEEDIEITDMSKSFVLHTSRGSDDGPDTLKVVSSFSQSDKVEFSNYGAGAGAIVDWSVISGPDIDVQRGEIPFDTEASLPLSIGQVNLSSSFIIVDSKLNSGVSADNVEGFFSGRFVDDSNVVFEREGGSAEGVLSWQVVDWAGVNVQSGSLNISEGSLINTNLINQIDLNKSVLIFSTNLFGYGGVEDLFVKGNFSSDSEVMFSRVGSGGNVTVEYFVLESDLFDVQGGNYIHLENGDVQGIDLFDVLVNFNRAFDVHSHENEGAGNSFGSAFVTQLIEDNNTINLQKGVGSDSGVTSWFSVEIRDLNNPFLDLFSPIQDYNYTGHLVGPFIYSLDDESNMSNCSLYGSWNGGWHLNQTLYGVDSENLVSFSSVDVGISGFYDWGVECYDIYGNYNLTGNRTFSSYLPPTEPEFVNITQTANDGTGAIIFVWNETNDTSKYRIYYGDDLSGFVFLDETTDTNYTDMTFAGHKRRFYKVESWNPSSTNMSSEIFGAHVYELAHNSVKSMNWIGFPTNFSYLENANDSLNEINGVTSISRLDTSTQKRVTCNGFSCPSSFACTDTNCNFDLNVGEGYEVSLNKSGGAPSLVNWSGVGIVYPPVQVNLVYDETGTRFNKNWISMTGFTGLEDARDLSVSLLGEDTLTNWNVKSQKSEGLFQLVPGFFVGTNFKIEMEKAYEVSVTQDSVWMQE